MIRTEAIAAAGIGPLYNVRVTGARPAGLG